MKKIRRLGINPFYKISCLLLFLTCCNATFATNEEIKRVKFFVVWENNGGVVSFPLSTTPRVTFDVEKAQVNCVTSQREVCFSMENVLKYTLEVTPDPVSGVEDITLCQGDVSQQSQTLYFRNFPPHTEITIYLIDGKLKASYLVGGNGQLEISTNSWNSGVYLVKAGMVTYKIMKK